MTQTVISAQFDLGHVGDRPLLSIRENESLAGKPILSKTSSKIVGEANSRAGNGSATDSQPNRHFLSRQ